MKIKTSISCNLNLEKKILKITTIKLNTTILYNFKGNTQYTYFIKVTGTGMSEQMFMLFLHV